MFASSAWSVLSGYGFLEQVKNSELVGLVVYCRNSV